MTTKIINLRCGRCMSTLPAPVAENYEGQPTEIICGRCCGTSGPPNYTPFPKGSSSTEQRWLNTALRFPTLRDSADEWMLHKKGPVTGLDEWVQKSPRVTSGSMHAAKFMLGVWNSRRLKLKFDFHRAANCWDDSHLRAFLAFARAPWYA